MRLHRLIPGFALVLLAIGASASHAQHHGLGDRPPTPEEQAYIDEVCTEVEYIEPNDFAKERVLAEIEAALQEALPAPALDGLPGAADNSILPYFPPIGDQETQSSCTAWAACYYYDTYLQAMDGGHDVSGGDPEHVCSPAFMYPLVNGGVDEGANTAYVVARLNDVGCASLALRPYESPTESDYTSWPSEEAWIGALENRTQSAHTIWLWDDPGTPLDDSGIPILKQHLANGHIAVTRFDVYDNFFDYPDDSVDGINNDVYYARSWNWVGGHAVTVVGYDDSKAYIDHRDGQEHYGAFLLANSWGPDWGVQNSTGIGTNGFFWAAYELVADDDGGFGQMHTSARIATITARPSTRWLA